MRGRSIAFMGLITIFGIGAGLYGLEVQSELAFWAGIYLEGMALGFNLGYLRSVLDRA